MSKKEKAMKLKLSEEEVLALIEQLAACREIVRHHNRKPLPTPPTLRAFCLPFVDACEINDAIRENERIVLKDTEQWDASPLGQLHGTLRGTSDGNP